MSSITKFIPKFIFILIIFISIVICKMDFIQAMLWPSYTTISIDDQADRHASSTVEHEIFKGQAADTFHNIFAQLEIENIPSELATNTAYQIFFNPPGYDLIWYKFKLKYNSSAQYNLNFYRSTNNGTDWSTLETYSTSTLSNGEYDSGTLGVKITTTTPGYVEFYTKKTYIEEPATYFNFYFSTLFSDPEIEADRAPTSSTDIYNLNEAIDQATIDPPNLAPETVDQGQINIPMTRLTASSSSGTVEWTALRIDKTSSSTMEDIDVDKIKIWKDDGDLIFDTDKDMLVADAQDPFASSTANIILNPAQIFTASSSYYFITYDIDWFAGIDRTVGLYIGDKTYFTVSSPDNINSDYFPFIAGNSKIITEPYLSFNISGIDADISVEGEMTDISTGGFGWIDFQDLTPNLSAVAGQKLNIMTNSETGYRITIQENQNLINLKNSNIIPDISGTNSSPSVWPASGGFGYHTSDDILESGTVDRFSADNTYAAITSSSEEVAYKNSATTVDGDIISIVYKLEIDSLQAIGKYSNVVTYVCTTTY